MVAEPLVGGGNQLAIAVATSRLADSTAPSARYCTRPERACDCACRKVDEAMVIVTDTIVAAAKTPNTA
jgi:hypothetical protein